VLHRNAPSDRNSSVTSWGPKGAVRLLAATAVRTMANGIANFTARRFGVATVADSLGVLLCAHGS